MLTREVIKNIPLKNMLPNLPKNVLGLSEDSRCIQSEWLFFAIDGAKHKGIEFVDAAIENGANAIVSQTDWHGSIPNICVENVREALGLCAANFYNHPTQNFYLNGVTGTNGKTTSTYVLHALWANYNAGLLGTIETRFANTVKPSQFTTPSSVVLQKCFAEMVKFKTTHVTMEASSHALDQHRTSGCHFDSAIFTNLTQDHLDYHGTLQDYFRSKQNLFLRELVQSEKQNKLAVINADCEFGKQLIDKVKKTNIRVLSYSLKDENADLFCKISKQSLQATEYQLHAFGETHFGTTNLIGSHNIENLLGALAVAQHSGIKLPNAIELAKKIAVPGRLEKIGPKNTFVDYAHTPDALNRVLSMLKSLKDANSKLIVVFGCGGNRDKDKRPMMGRIANELADVVIVTSDNPRDEDPQTIANNIATGISQDSAKIHFELDRKKAIVLALNLQNQNDVLLIAGKGHETTQTIGRDILDFDDRKVLLDLL